MNTKERIMYIMLLEKIKNNPKVAKELGLEGVLRKKEKGEITYEDNREYIKRIR